MNVNDLVKNIRSKLEEIKRALAELEGVLNMYTGGPEPPPDFLIPRIFVWFEIYKRGGIIDMSELRKIADKYYENGAQVIGGFFTGERPSLRRIGIRKDKAELQEWAVKEVEEYKEWIEENIEKYKVKS